jgi:hypothetical protein
VRACTCAGVDKGAIASTVLAAVRTKQERDYTTYLRLFLLFVLLWLFADFIVIIVIIVYKL